MRCNSKRAPSLRHSGLSYRLQPDYCPFGRRPVQSETISSARLTSNRVAPPVQARALQEQAGTLAPALGFLAFKSGGGLVSGAYDETSTQLVGSSKFAIGTQVPAYLPTHLPRVNPTYDRPSLPSAHRYLPTYLPTYLGLTLPTYLPT